MSELRFKVIQNPERKRFEVKVSNKLAVCEYIQLTGKIIFTHTAVPPGLEGMGIGSSLARKGLKYARENQLKVQPLCPYIAGYMKKHPEEQDLLMEGFHLR